MVFFGTTRQYLGLDIGSSSLKVVELIDRHRRIDVATYASVNSLNELINPVDSNKAIKTTADLIMALLEQGDVVADYTIAALPASSVFSTVVKLPVGVEADMDAAVRAVARDTVPADLNDMVLGWNRVGELPHMEGDAIEAKSDAATPESKPSNVITKTDIPVFITAAPKDLVDRYTKTIQQAGLELIALEVETFPLVRSLLYDPTGSALIVDIGDATTSFHIIDAGTPRVSHSIDYGGLDITRAIVAALNISMDQAEQLKMKYGLRLDAPEKLHTVITEANQEVITKGKQLLDQYITQEKRSINKIIFIGGGANLQGLSETWSKQTGFASSIGNPWKGLAYPEALQPRVQQLGPTYAVAVGLAQRGIQVSRAQANS